MYQKLYPITKSLLAPHALAQHIAAAYGLAHVGCQLLTATMRDVYLVTSAQQRFVLFVYPHQHRAREHILAEWALIAFLAHHGVPVAPALPARDGTILLTFDAPEGLRYGVLSHWLPGDILRRHSSPQAVEQYGAHIATIHVLADSLPAPLSRPINDPIQITLDALMAAEAALPDRSDVRAMLYQARDRVLPAAQALVALGSSYGFIHGDVIRANALVASDGTVSILDFDLCGLGWRAYDVASYLFTIRGTADEPVLRRAFLHGYTQIRPLSTAEHATFPLFEAVRAIFDIGIPARYVNTWGRAYLDAFLDASVVQLKQCVDQTDFFPL
jgi:Ser/Thr protein kinase RdoA (MazF antagonist)